jgi:hypothetical protein
VVRRAEPSPSVPLRPPPSVQQGIAFVKRNKKTNRMNEMMMQLERVCEVKEDKRFAE